MNKKEIQAEVDRRLASGEGKTAVFRQLQNQGVSDAKLAHMIASHADERLCQQHGKLVKTLIAITWVQLVFVVIAALAAGVKMSLVACLLFVAFAGAFGYLFVWGFGHHKAWAYNAAILLSIINLPKALEGLKDTPVETTVALLISVAVIAFTWFVRGKLFPDFVAFGPRKVKGQYVFTS